MVLSYHHILLDEWSTGIILKEFIEAYSSFINNKKFLTYNNIKTYKCKNWKNSIELDSELINNIDNLKREHKLTFATIIYTEWGILLHKCKLIDDIIFGTTVSGRPASIKGIKNMVGLFINTLPHRFKMDYNKTVKELLRENFNQILERQEYEYIPLSDINNHANIQPSNELFDTAIVIQNYPLDKVLSSDFITLNLKFKSIFETTQYDLTLIISMIDCVKIDFIYNNEVFDETYVKEIATLFSNILKSIIKYPEATMEQYITEYLFIEQNLSKKF